MAQQPGGQLDTVMQETRLFAPPKQFAQRTKIGSLAAYETMWREAASDIEAFWGKLAGELHWFRPFEKVLEWNEPDARWFVGGQTNICYNCLDAHFDAARARAGKPGPKLTGRADCPPEANSTWGGFAGT